MLIKIAFSDWILSPTNGFIVISQVILKEREEKKRMRLLDEPPMSPESEEAASQILAVPGMPLDGDLSQDGK